MINKSKVSGLIFLAISTSSLTLFAANEEPNTKPVPGPVPTYSGQAGLEKSRGVNSNKKIVENSNQVKGGVPAQGFVMNDPMKINGVTVPAILGQVLSLTGTSFTAVMRVPGNKSITESIYTIDATGARMVKDGVAATAAEIMAGDSVAVNGSVSGTVITAKSIVISRGKFDIGIDPEIAGGENGQQTKMNYGKTNAASSSSDRQPSEGFFAKIKKFILRLFGM